MKKGFALFHGGVSLRSAQGIFRDVHAAAKYGFDLIRGLWAANSVRQEKSRSILLEWSGFFL